MGWKEDLAEIKKLSIKDLITALSDSDKCGFAAEELGEIGDLEDGDPKRVSSAVEPLIKVLDNDDENREYAAWALAKIADPRALDALIRAYRNEGYSMVGESKDYATRNSIAWGLGRIGDARAVKPLVEMLDDAHEVVRDSASEALEKIGKPAIRQRAEHYVGLSEFDEAIDIYEALEEMEEVTRVRKLKIREREELLDYDSAIQMWEELGENKEAARVRKLKANQGAVKVEQTVVHGDYIDDRDTTIQDSVVSRSNVGSGGKSKAEELREVKALLDDGIIDDDEFQQMKKEILGK